MAISPFETVIDFQFARLHTVSSFLKLFDPGH